MGGAVRWRGVAGLVLIALAAVVLAAQPAGAAKRKRDGKRGERLGVACQSGLFAIERLGSGSEIDPDALAFAGLEVELLGGRVALRDHCPPVPAGVKLRRDGTALKARWSSCDGFPRGVRLEGTIDAAACSLLDGEIQAPGVARPIQFSARQRLLSGDGTVGGGGDGGGNPDDGGGTRGGGSSSRSAHKGFQRWYADFSPRAFPVGAIPPGALEQGFHDLMPAPIPLEQWVSIGPAPIRRKPGDSSESVRSINSGRVDALAVDPLDTAHWLIGAATGGVWETFDAGATWHPRTDDQPSLAISALAFAPSARNVVYAGTGNYNPQGTGPYPGVGILKSIDGGTTWGWLGAADLAGLGFGGIAVHPLLPNAVVAATLQSVPGAYYQAYLPPGGGEPGVYRTSDGGASWDLELPGQATAVAAHPSAPFFFLYAGLEKSASDLRSASSFDKAKKGGVYRSFDGGQSWHVVKGPWTSKRGGVGEVRIAVSPSDPDVVYVSIRDATDEQGNDGYLLGVWRTENAWDPTPAWTALPTPAIPPFGTHALLVHGADPEIVYLASGGPPLWKWIDGQWLTIGQVDPTNPNSADAIHVDPRSLAWVGTTSLLVGNDGGVYLKNEVSGGPWIERNHGLAIAQFRGGSVHPSDPDAVIGGAQDNGASLMLPPAGLVWKGIPAGGDGMGGFFGAVAQQLAFFLQYGIVQRSLDGGANFANGLHALPPGEQGAAWPTQAVRCPSDPDHVLYGAYRVWKSGNFFSAASHQSIAWTAKSPAMNLTKPVGFVTALAFAPSDASCATYAYANNLGRVFLTTDDGATWLPLNPASELPPRIPTGLAFAPDDADVLWVTFSGYDAATPTRPGHVFRSAGATGPLPAWTNVSPGVDLPFNAVSVHPSDPDVVYVGCDLGVWSTADGGATWEHHGPAVGMPNVPVTALQVGPCGTTAFTFGRSAFRTTSILAPLCDE